MIFWESLIFRNAKSLPSCLAFWFPPKMEAGTALYLPIPCNFSEARCCRNSWTISCKVYLPDLPDLNELLTWAQVWISSFCNESLLLLDKCWCLPSLKIRSRTWKLMVGIRVYFGAFRPIFTGELLVLGSVYYIYKSQETHSESKGYWWVTNPRISGSLSPLSYYIYLDLPNLAEWMIRGAQYTIPSDSTSTLRRMLAIICIKGKVWVPLGGYPSSCSPRIAPYCPIQPLSNTCLGGICWYILLGYSPKGTQLFPLDALGSRGGFIQI